MTFNTRKALAGQEYCTIATIHLDRCRHTTAQSVIDGAITSNDAVNDSYTGTLSITGGTATSFENSSPYILWDSELIKVDVDSDSQLTITARAQLGTVADSHSAGAVKLMHSGEADGTCQLLPNTCSSSDSFLSGLTYPFRFPSTQLDVSEIFYTGFQSWGHSPTEVDPGESMGKRAGGSFNVKDGRDFDTYVPYPERRTNNGTLFNKLLARNPNFEGRKVTIQTGFDPLNYDENNFINREYVIDSVSLSKGVFSVKFLDPLILTEDKKAKAPVTSQGALATFIEDASTQFTYTNAPALGYGAVSSVVYVRIGSEVIKCSVLSDFVLTITERAIGGTAKKDHNVNSSVQLCLVYEKVNVVDIIEDLITNYTNIDASYLDDYTAIKAQTSSILLSANINKPAAVKDLINELIKNGDLVLYYNEETQKIVIQAVSDASADIININEDDHIKQDSVSFVRDVNKQFTRYSVGWAVNNITKDKDEEYFGIIYQGINLTKELPQAKGEVNEKKIFFNRWLTDDNDDVIIGTGIAQKTLDRSSEVPEVASFILDVSSVFDTQGSNLNNGSVFNLSTSRSVNVDGTNKAVNHQILSMKDLGNMQYQIKSRLFQDPVIDADFTISTNKENYDLSSEYAPAAGNYTVLIDSGVTIGSTNTSIPAFTTGTQAAGVTFNIIVRGSILGMGGAGGAGGILTTSNPGINSEQGTDGLVGGNAFEATVDCTINTGSGVIWAGGAGSAGMVSVLVIVGGNPIYVLPGNGGCGGQGYATSFGGNRGSITYNAQTTYGTNGTDGNKSTQGILSGQEGGEFGGDGDNDDGSYGSSNGGLSGFAIVSNGNNVTISNGDNEINIKGRRS